MKRIFVVYAVAFWMGTTFAAFAQEAPAVTAQIVQGKAAFDRSDFKEAVSIWQSALPEVRKSGTKQRLADLLSNIGLAYQQLDDASRAKAAYVEAREAYRETGDQVGEAKTIQDLAGIDRLLGHDDEALTLYGQALTIFGQTGNHIGEGEIRYNIALIDIARAKNDEAVNLLQQALAVFREQHARRDEGATLRAIANVDEALGRYDDALSSARAAVSIARETNSAPLEAQGLLECGNVQFRFGHFEDALELYRQAFSRYRDIQSSSGQATALANSAQTDIHLGHYQEALTFAVQALTMEEQIGDRSGQALALNAEGGANARLGNFDAALDADRRAIAIFRDLKDRFHEIDILQDLGNLELGRGHYDDALADYEQALEVSRAFGNRRGEQNAEGAIGLIDDYLGRHDAAIEAQQQALAIARAIEDEYAAGIALTDLGLAQRSAGRIPDAFESFRQALLIHQATNDRHAQGADLLNLGLLDAEIGKFDDARSEYQKRIDIDRSLGDKRSEAIVLVDMGRLDDTISNFPRALQETRDAVAILREARDVDPDVMANALGLLAFAEEHLDMRAAALADFDAGVAQQEELRNSLDRSERGGFSSLRGGNYDDYIDYLIRLDAQYPGRGYDRKAVEILERKAARSLLDQLSESAAQRYRDVPPEILARDRDTQLAIDAARVQLATADVAGESSRIAAQAALDTAVAQRRAFEDRMQVAYPAFYALVHPKPISVDALQQRVLGDDEAMLIYNVTPFSSAVVAVTRDRVVASLLPPDPVLEASVRKLRKHIDAMLEIVDGHLLPDRAIAVEASEDLPAFASDSYALYKQLVPPTLEALLGKKRLIIVPAGPLYDAPWEALVTQLPNPAPHYLIEDHAVSYIPSGSLLGLVRGNERHGPGRSPLLAFADPATAGGEFPELPGTAVEAVAVRDALHASNDSVITGEDATKRKLFAYNDDHELAKYRYILFATHAVLPRHLSSVDQPALVLAHPERDGVVTMNDVFGLSLDADFVALSACNTGTGAGDTGDGISGLTRAFIYAGTPAISVTLWEVDDLVAPLITPPFFAAMNGGLTASEALRQAKLTLLHSDNPRFRHPYAWAPTVIFGEGGASKRMPPNVTIP